VPQHTSGRLGGVFRALGSLLPEWSRRVAYGARIVRPWREDSVRIHPTVGLTPSRLLSYLQAADAGTPQMQFEVFHEMLQKWPRLAAVEQTRRLALTGLDWEVLPATQPGMDGATARAAVAAADYCRETLRSLERFDEALDHLAHAIGAGVAVAELVWQNSRLVDLVPVPDSRLVSDPHEPWRLRILTEEESDRGVAVDEQTFKWVVHEPRAQAGRRFDGGLLRASALLYVAQNLSFKDWLIFSEIAGMPVRVAQFDPGTPEPDKQELLKMLQALGTDAVAAFGKNVDLKLLDVSHSGERPYQPLQDHCNTEVTILWLGQHLTTDLRTSGSRAAAEIHDRVREDLLVNDIAAEGRTVRREVLTPMVRAHLGDAVPVPRFRRSLAQAVDTKVLAGVLAVAINQLGLAVPKRWIHQSLGIPEPSANEPVVVARRAP